MKPRFYSSTMAGAPQYNGPAAGARALPDIIFQCLVSGFNILTPSSAVAAGGFVTYNYAAPHGYDARSAIRVSNSAVTQANGDFSISSQTSNSIVLECPGVPDGVVAGANTRVAPAGWLDSGLTPSATSLAIRQGPGSSGLPQRFVLLSQPGVANASPKARVFDVVGSLTENDASNINPNPPFSVDAAGNPPQLAAYQNPESNAGPWAILATDRWFHIALKNGLRPGFIGDLHDVLNPGDAGACCIWAVGGGTTTVRLYLSTPVSQQLAPTSSNFDVAADWGSMPAFDVGTPTLALTCGPVYELGQATNRARGFVPNLYRVYPRPAAANSHIIVDPVEGIEGRLFLTPYGYAWSLDEEWL